MPDCKDTSALVPLYNEIQATTTFAGSALFFSLYTICGSLSGSRPWRARPNRRKLGKCQRHLQGWGIPGRHAASSA